MVTIRIRTGTDAFGDKPHELAHELSRILEELSRDVSFCVPTDLSLYDFNGNSVGLFRYDPEEG